MTSTSMPTVPRVDRSWWMEEALAHPEFAGPPAAALEGDTTADVVILGGGYTGMWTAYFLKERDPDLDVVLLEQDICGGGPSGRNGGFVNGWWSSAGELARRYGDSGAMELALAASRSVEEIGAFCERSGVDAWFTHAGELAVASNPFQEGLWEGAAEQAERFGVGDAVRELSAERVAAICGSPVFGGGLFDREAATVQPARLARGLRRVLVERGVRIHERSPVSRFSPGPPAVAQTPNGSVLAADAVVAVGSWGIHWKRFRPYLTVRGSYIVLTEPAPDRLVDIGWTGGEAIRDYRPSLHYLRTTPDGRIAIGCAGMQPGFARRIGPRFQYDERFLAKAVADLHRMFPGFRDVPIAAGWGGPIDVAGTYVPFLGSFEGGNVHYALGFTGNGVAPCHLAGKVLASLAMHAEDGFSRLAIVNDRPKRFPPEPLRSPGALLVNEAIRRKDDAEDAGHRAGPVTTFLARIPRRLGYNLGPRR
jgi:glycine/D-amino acid oxidase-like deaminating enzyme